jgi:hypothetical protein
MPRTCSASRTRSDIGVPCWVVYPVVRCSIGSSRSRCGQNVSYMRTACFCEGLTIRRRSGIIISPVSIVTDISGPKDAVQEPQCHPVRSVFSICLPAVEQSALVGASSCLLPCIQDGLTASIWTDVVPEERCLGLGVAPLFVNQIRPISVDSIIHGNGLVLVQVVSVGELLRTSPCNSLAWHDTVLHAEDCWYQGATLS